MNVMEALTTTRAMRRMRPDAIPLEVQRDMLQAAICAPNGGNFQGWRFVLVDDRAIVSKLTPVYRERVAGLWRRRYAETAALAEADPTAPESVAFLRLRRSVEHLADEFEHVPLLLFTYANRETGQGSTIPATWSAMLAARAHGVGSSFVSLLADEPDVVSPLLGVPEGAEGAGWRLHSAVAFGYPTGRWGVPLRRPIDEVAARNSWQGHVGLPDPSSFPEFS